MVSTIVKRLAAALAGLCVLASCASAAIYKSEDPARLMWTIRIPVAIGDMAQIRFPDGSSIDIGRVLAVPTASRHPGFTASKYGMGGQIIATAANTHHIQIDVEDGAGRTMSIVPMRTYVAASGTNSSFVIEGEGGIGLWGRYSPFVGSPVYVINQIGVPVLFNTEQVYKFASAIEVRVYRPIDDIEYFEVENKQFGRAWYHDSTGDHEFAVVEQKVSGTGRFEGTLFVEPGMVRANHPGVVCVSTSERGTIGGFQIVPRSHTFSHELQKTRRMTQYIVLRGPEFEDLTGMPPFYREHVRPGDASEPSTAGRVICRIDGEWRPMPIITGLTERTLDKIEAFRIYISDASELPNGSGDRQAPPETEEDKFSREFDSLAAKYLSEDIHE